MPNVAELIKEQVTLEVECVDRLYPAREDGKRQRERRAERAYDQKYFDSRGLSFRVSWRTVSY